MQVELKIDADAVQRQVVDALMKSAIGAEIEKAIQKILAERHWSHGSVVEQAVRDAMFTECKRIAHDAVKLLEPQLTEQISQRVTAEAANRTVNEIIGRLWREP